MLLLSATGRRNSTVHLSNNTNKYKNRHYQVPYRTSYPVQSSSPVQSSPVLLLLLLLLLQNTNGYLSVVTILQYIFILETLDSGISLEGINLPPTCPRADIKPPRFSKRAAWQKNTIMTFCETNHQTIIGPDQEHVSHEDVHGPMDARPVIPHARPSSHREGKSVPE